MHIHRGDSVIFLLNLSAFLLHSTWVKIFPGLYNFPDAPAILMVTLPTYEDMPPVEHATHTTYTALSLKKYLYPVYFK